MSTGTLIIRPKQAKLKRDTDTFSKMDPYCKVTIGGSTRQTVIAQGAGKYPTWKDTLTFNVVNDDYMNVEIWDSDMTNDDLVGDLQIPLKEAYELGKVSKWYTLSYKGKNAGEVSIEQEFKPSVMNTQQPQFLNYGSYGNTTSMMMSTQQFQPMFGNVQNVMQNQYQGGYNQYQQNPYQQQTIYNQNPYQQQQVYQQPNLYQQQQYQQQQYQQQQYQEQQLQQQPQQIVIQLGLGGNDTQLQQQKEQEELLKKQEEELKKKQEELKKQELLIKMQEEALKKQQEEQQKLLLLQQQQQLQQQQLQQGFQQQQYYQPQQLQQQQQQQQGYQQQQVLYAPQQQVYQQQVYQQPNVNQQQYYQQPNNQYYQYK